MAQKKSYSRYFIILQEDEKGYALASDKLPSGYVKLEVRNDKCKISYYVQNLKCDMGPYYMLLICSKKDTKKLINIGPMNIEESGSTEVCYECLVENVANSSIGVDKITGASIVKMVDKDIVSIMCGFATTDIPEWKSYPLIDSNRKRHLEENDDKEIRKDNKEEIKEEAKEEVKEEVKEEIKEEIKQEIKQEIKDAFREQTEEVKSEFDKYEESIETAKLEMDSDNSKEVINKDSDEYSQNVDILDIKVDDEFSDRDEQGVEVEVDTEFDDSKEELLRSKEKKEEKKEEYEDFPIGDMGMFFKKLMEDHQEVKNVGSDIKRCKWYKIGVKNLEDMCDASNYNKYTIVYYPMISYYPYIKKYGHYMMGYKCDAKGQMKYLVYAIPGRKSKWEQPYGGKSGFVTWVPLNSEKNNSENFGYWLMFYDFRTSTIVIPIK